MPEYVFRTSLCLNGLLLSLFETHFHRFGIEIKDNNNKVLLVFNARNQLDQKRFAEDLQESILETNEMETQRQQMTKTSSLLALASQQSQSADQREEHNNQNESQNRRKSSSGKFRFRSFASIERSFAHKHRRQQKQVKSHKQKK